MIGGDKLEWIKCWVIGVIGMIFGALFMVYCLSSYNTYSIGKERKMVSYEYTTKCRCGGTIEGYQSLVDGFNQEECKSCGYHREVNDKK